MIKKELGKLVMESNSVEGVEAKRQNPLPCGCGIKGTRYLDPLGTKGYEYKDLFIDFCPTHTAAPALYEALKTAHNCATLRDDGSCDGCSVSTALALVSSKEEK